MGLSHDQEQKIVYIAASSKYQAMLKTANISKDRQAQLAASAYKFGCLEMSGPLLEDAKTHLTPDTWRRTAHPRPPVNIYRTE
jgi:hypothetical protein